MKKIIVTLALMLTVSFAFANDSSTNLESFTDSEELYTINLCEDTYAIYLDGELVAEWSEPAPLDENMDCTGDHHLYLLKRK